ncbi:UNKNOWN [Stylonychia lemnae]|uniref:Stress-associated endoplasmic reticulum protein 2-like n=1 Tax=Stylonychia lemnae TaxID=5949 RepID=A0A078A0R8_STYLE|nr:UNKNOWN [Stylonychia lemnae]|eukprot:CDW75452.1 UNKNOWN [Stylonychia lemnae]
MGKATADRRLKHRGNMYEQNIHKSGETPSSLRKSEDKIPVGPVVLGLFLFLVVGSALFQVLNASINAGVVE